MGRGAVQRRSKQSVFFRLPAILVALVIVGCSTFKRTGEMSSDFCSQNNPDFKYNGNQCCGTYKVKVRGIEKAACSPERNKRSYCDEMSAEQLWYQQSIDQGRYPDILSMISVEKRSRPQAYCSVNDGFLVESRQLIPNSKNRLKLRFPDRCTNFGTEAMVGMIEWTGRKVNEQYSAKHYAKTNLVVADISTPRGGCIWGHTGRSSHLSHTNGHDADIGFLTPVKNQESPTALHTRFDAKANWWLIKSLFNNPYACVKNIFLDQRLIHTLAHQAGKDPAWKEYRHYIRHVKGHHNHMHIRIGDGPDAPGCPRDLLKNKLNDADEDLDEEDIG